MRNMLLLPLVALLLALSACVTINIYFPAAEAEKAADKIIDDVWQIKKGEQPSATPAATPAPEPTK
jgi:hypothetical protein